MNRSAVLLSILLLIFAIPACGDDGDGSDSDAMNASSSGGTSSSGDTSSGVSSGGGGTCADPSVCSGDARTPTGAASVFERFAGDYTGEAGITCPQDPTTNEQFAAGNPYDFTISADQRVIVTGGSATFTYVWDDTCDRACNDTNDGTHLVTTTDGQVAPRIRISFNDSGEMTVFQFEDNESLVLCQLINPRPR